MSPEREPYKSSSTCGSVNSRTVSWDENDRDYRKGARSCKKCDELKNVRRRCTSCDHLFQPGCRAPFTCARCLKKRRSD
jgi:hypothetical protein